MLPSIYHNFAVTVSHIAIYHRCPDDRYPSAAIIIGARRGASPEILYDRYVLTGAIIEAVNE